MNKTPRTLKVIQDALSQAGISGDGRFSGGAHLGALDQPAQAGAIALEGAIRKSTAIAARAIRTSDQAITTATYTAISYASVSNDSFSMWASGSPTRLTAQFSGLYALWCELSFDADTTGQRYVIFRVNGSTDEGAQVFSGASYAQFVSNFALVYLGEGDYVEVVVYQNCGSDLNVIGSNGISFVMARIA